MRAILATGFLLLCATALHAQTAEQIVVQFLTGTKNYDSMKVTRLDGCRFKLEAVPLTTPGEYFIVDFSKMREYSARQLPDRRYLIRMAGDPGLVFWRIRDRHFPDGYFTESSTHELNIHSTRRSPWQFPSRS